MGQARLKRLAAAASGSAPSQGRPVPLPALLLAHEKAVRPPSLWRTVDELHAAGMAGRPRWAHLRMDELGQAYGAAHRGSAPRFASSLREIGMDRFSPRKGAFVQAWRASRAIYRFDPDLARELRGTAYDGPLDPEAFKTMPHPALWIQAGCPEDLAILGRADDEVLSFQFGVCLRPAEDPETPVLDICLLFPDGPRPPVFAAYSLILDGRLIGEALVDFDAVSGQATDPAAKEAAMTLCRSAVSLVLWLCQGPEAEAVPSPSASGPAPLAVSVGSGTETVAGPREWTVGQRIGAAFRSSAGCPKAIPKGGTHAGPRPHVRRGHWHTYLHGKGRAERKVVFVHPCVVGTADRDSLVATVSRVGP